MPVAIVWKISKDDFERFVKESECWADLGRKCGYKNPHNRVTIKKRIDKEGHDISHFVNNPHRGYSFKSTPIEEIMVEHSSFSTTQLKFRLIKTGFFERKCSMCNLSEWLGKPIPIELDHINGDNCDHRAENLRLLCPNCHALTPNYKGKNRTKPLIYNKCKDCDETIAKKSERCRSCASKQINMPYRKVKNRPSVDEIEEMTKSMSMVAIGKKYGVSSNAVKSWIKVGKKETN